VKPRRYRCARALLLLGRVIAPLEIIRLEERTAAEHVASGHLIALDVAEDQARDLGPPLSDAPTHR